jgi:hypothetical protein
MANVKGYLFSLNEMLIYGHWTILSGEGAIGLLKKMVSSRSHKEFMLVFGISPLLLLYRYGIVIAVIAVFSAVKGRW